MPLSIGAYLSLLLVAHRNISMAFNANELFMVFNKAAMTLLHAACLRMPGPGHRLEKEGSGGTVACFISDTFLTYCWRHKVRAL